MKYYYVVKKAEPKTVRTGRNIDLSTVNCITYYGKGSIKDGVEVAEGSDYFPGYLDGWKTEEAADAWLVRQIEMDKSLDIDDFDVIEIEK